MNELGFGLELGLGLRLGFRVRVGVTSADEGCFPCGWVRVRARVRGR